MAEIIELTKDNFEEARKEMTRLIGGCPMTFGLKDFFEGHITAEFNFDIIDVFKQHFRVHNIVILSFRPNIVIIQTMTAPYPMPDIDAKGLYTTLIPLSSMKEYEYGCNRKEVNVIIAKSLVLSKYSCNCINVVADNTGIIFRGDYCGEVKNFAEVAFDIITKLGKDVKFETTSAFGFGRFVNEPYKHFLIRSLIDCTIQDDYKDIVNLEPNQSVLVNNPKAFKTFYNSNVSITVGKNGYFVFEGYGDYTKFIIGNPKKCEKDFELPGFLFLKLFKFIGAIRDDTNFEIIKPNVMGPVLMAFKINSNFYTTYAIFGVVI